ncbi:ABC transporter permease [Hwanghaeella grinnelliae]|uniref:ABC transporter permease n=1 Tax=Hwanghaeella grinnelliae TaxID=2500179 RepID=UPI001386C3E9|nr:MlaE family lipid ABC transporter permease subunit [Hwanghaeella grinnelliae]
MSETHWTGRDGHGHKSGSIELRDIAGKPVLALSGVWSVPTAAALSRQIADLSLPSQGQVGIDLTQVSVMDTSGAWLIHGLMVDLKKNGAAPTLENLKEQHAPLMHLVEGAVANPDESIHSKSTSPLRLLEITGEATIAALSKGRELTNFVGMLTVSFLRAVKSPSRLRPISIVNQLELTGLRAIPIIGLLSFLIGVTLAYLMADQFRAYGLDVFTVNVLGIFVLREAGVLITAIVIAGRSGSAFTAEIGTMKVNEELDALRTLGLDPVEVLVLPRVLALVITLPFLAFWADLMGLLGGGMMTMLVLDMTPLQFVQQLKEAVNLKTFMVGLVKAPVHAYIIAVVGCFEGFKVQRSAESVGKQTTTSVVEAIFLVIVATAAFSVMFSVLGI